MKIISSTCEHIPIKKYHCNFLYFHDPHKEFLFRKEVGNWMLPRKDLNHLFYVLLNDREMTPKTIQCLELFGGTFDNIPEKIFQLWIKHQINDIPYHYHRFQEINYLIESFFENSSFRLGSTEIELLFNEFTIDNLLKLCKIGYSHEAGEFKSYNHYRNLTIEMWRDLNFEEKDCILFYNYPEIDGDMNEVISFLKNLESEKLTVVCITRSELLMKHFAINQCHLIRQNGTFYPIHDLFLQLMAFNLFEDVENLQEIAIELAFKDFTEQYNFLDPTISEFLLSSRF